MDIIRNIWNDAENIHMKRALVCACMCCGEAMSRLMRALCSLASLSLAASSSELALRSSLESSHSDHSSSSSPLYSFPFSVPRPRLHRPPHLPPCMLRPTRHRPVLTQGRAWATPSSCDILGLQHAAEFPSTPCSCQRRSPLPGATKGAHERPEDVSVHGVDGALVLPRLENLVARHASTSTGR